MQAIPAFTPPALQPLQLEGPDQELLKKLHITLTIGDLSSKACGDVLKTSKKFSIIDFGTNGYCVIAPTEKNSFVAFINVEDAPREEFSKIVTHVLGGKDHEKVLRDPEHAKKYIGRNFSYSTVFPTIISQHIQANSKYEFVDFMKPSSNIIDSLAVKAILVHGIRESGVWDILESAGQSYVEALQDVDKAADYLQGRVGVITTNDNGRIETLVLSPSGPDRTRWDRYFGGTGRTRPDKDDANRDILALFAKHGAALLDKLTGTASYYGEVTLYEGSRCDDAKFTRTGHLVELTILSKTRPTITLDADSHDAVLSAQLDLQGRALREALKIPVGAKIHAAWVENDLNGACAYVMQDPESILFTVPKGKISSMQGVMMGMDPNDYPILIPFRVGRESENGPVVFARWEPVSGRLHLIPGTESETARVVVSRKA